MTPKNAGAPAMTPDTKRQWRLATGSAAAVAALNGLASAWAAGHIPEEMAAAALLPPLAFGMQAWVFGAKLYPGAVARQAFANERATALIYGNLLRQHIGFASLTEHLKQPSTLLKAVACVLIFVLTLWLAPASNSTLTSLLIIGCYVPALLWLPLGLSTLNLVAVGASVGHGFESWWSLSASAGAALELLVFAWIQARLARPALLAGVLPEKHLENERRLEPSAIFRRGGQFVLVAVCAFGVLHRKPQKPPVQAKVRARAPDMLRLDQGLNHSEHGKKGAKVFAGTGTGASRGSIGAANEGNQGASGRGRRSLEAGAASDFKSGGGNNGRAGSSGGGGSNTGGAQSGFNSNVEASSGSVAQAGIGDNGRGEHGASGGNAQIGGSGKTQIGGSGQGGKAQIGGGGHGGKAQISGGGQGDKAQIGGGGQAQTGEDGHGGKGQISESGDDSKSQINDSGGGGKGQINNSGGGGSAPGDSGRSAQSGSTSSGNDASSGENQADGSAPSPPGSGPSRGRPTASSSVSTVQPPSLKIAKKPRARAPWLAFALLFVVLAVATVLLLKQRKKTSFKKSSVGTAEAGRRELTPGQRRAVAAKLAALYRRPVTDADAAGRMVVELYNAVLNLLAEWGWPRATEQTPDEFAETVGRKSPRMRAPLDVMTSIFCQVFYGRRPPNAEGYERFLASVAALAEPAAAPKKDRPAA